MEEFGVQTGDLASAAFVRLSEKVRPYASQIWEDADWRVSRDFLPHAAKLFARLAVLRHALRDMLQFRLRDRLQAISGIAMHNEFHSQLRTALSLDGSLDRLTNDAHLFEQQLASDLHRRDEESRRWLTAIASASASFAVLNEFFEIGIKLKWDHDIAIGLARFFADKTLLLGYEYMVSQRHFDEMWGVVVPLVFALLAGWISWRKKWTFPHY